MLTVQFIGFTSIQSDSAVYSLLLAFNTFDVKEQLTLSPTNMHSVWSKTDDWLPFRTFSSFAEFGFKRLLYGQHQHQHNCCLSIQFGSAVRTIRTSRRQAGNENCESFMLIAISHSMNVPLRQTYSSDFNRFHTHTHSPHIPLSPTLTLFNSRWALHGLQSNAPLCSRADGWTNVASVVDCTQNEHVVLTHFSYTNLSSLGDARLWPR